MAPATHTIIMVGGSSSRAMERTPPRRDKLGRRRLPDDRYAGVPSGSVLRHFVWLCKGDGCLRHHKASSKAQRFDTICTGCGTRNTIRWDSRKRSTWDDKRGRPRVTEFWVFSTAREAKLWAIARHQERAYHINRYWPRMGFVRAGDISALEEETKRARFDRNEPK